MPASDTLSNLVAARLLDEIAAMLRVQEATSYRVQAYERAADAVAMFPEPLERLAEEHRLQEIPRVGAAMAALLEELVRTGTIELHARLAAETPPTLSELLRLPGVTPVAARALYQSSGVSGLASLETAVREGRVTKLGRTPASGLLAAVLQARELGRGVRLKTAWETARLLRSELLAVGAVHTVQVVGAARRMVTEVLIDLVELTALPSGDADAALAAFVALPDVADVLERGPACVRVRLRDGIVARLDLGTPSSWGGVCLWRTGAASHLDRLRQRAEARGLQLGADGLRDDSDRVIDSGDEAALYGRLDLPWIAPELREDDGEIEAAEAGSLPTLVTVEDVRGDLHTHTEWTDGTAPLEAMARTARGRGDAYLAVTDHSQALAFIHGLTPERVHEQARLVAQLNHTLAPFVILHGTEMDILEDGRLDYPDELLAELDYVSASVHGRHRQDRAAMTARIERAVRHPLVNTLNHPFGRMLGGRDPYGVDMPAVLALAAAVGCAVEVSGDPARMDLDGGWARRAGLAGCRCTISTDAHSVLDFENRWIAIGSARRGWLTRDQIVNSRPLDELRALLAARRGGGL
ncbi:MAG: DNA polymerase III [Chloroflexi bacterium]|nr:DNA polymerase III [Chloroflexota bacterium]